MPEALSWIGMRIDDAYGARVGAVHDVYLEADGSPRWIFTLRRRVLDPRLGRDRRRRAGLGAVPARADRGRAAGSGRWTS